MYPLRMNHLTQPPPGVQQLGNGATMPCCDGLLVAGKVTSAGAQQFCRLPDIYPNFPYRWVSWADWESKVRTMVQRPARRDRHHQRRRLRAVERAGLDLEHRLRPARSTPAGPARTG